MKRIIFTLLVMTLLIVPMISAKELTIIPNGILNKFDNFRECFGGLEKSCNQFDYDKNEVIGFADFGKFIQKYSKMVK